MVVKVYCWDGGGDITTGYNNIGGLSPTIRQLTGHNSRKTQSRFRSDYHTHQHAHRQHNFYKHHIDGRQAQHTKGQDAYQLQALPDHIVWNITQRNNIRRANPCYPALNLLNEEITSDIQKHKPNLLNEHLDVHWDHMHNTYILWKTIHGLSNRAPRHTQTLP